MGQHHLAEFVGAVATAVEAGDLAATGEGACALDGQHDRFATRIGEADLVKAGHAVDECFGQGDFGLGREGERAAQSQRPAGTAPTIRGWVWPWISAV